MVLRGRDCRRQVTEAEFLKARQETLLLLAAKNPEHEFGGIGRAAAAHHGQNQAGEIGVIEIGDAAPSPPLRLPGALGRPRSFHAPISLLRWPPVSADRLPKHKNHRNSSRMP